MKRGDIHGNDPLPNILEVMSFRMSTRVTATVVCCILMQILCVVSQKASASGGLRPPDLQSSFMSPPNDPVRSTPLKRPNQQCQSTEGREVLRTGLQSH